MTNREQFLNDLFQFLKDIDYVILKYSENIISDIGKYSDIDLAIEKDECSKIIQYISTHKVVKKYRVNQNSFMDIIYLFFHDGSFLEIDLIRNFVRKDIVYINIKEMLKTKKTNHEEVKVPSIEYQFIYIYLFYILNHTDIETKYQEYFRKLGIEEQNKILNFFAGQYNIKTTKVENLFSFNQNFYNKIMVKLNKENQAIKRFINTINYLTDVLKNKYKSKIITFSGVDGAGKTTLLTEVKELLTIKYRKNVVVIRHRPSILPILSSIKHGKKKAEEKTMEVLPRSGKNSSIVSSLLRFGYYLVDYILGQWIVFVRHSLKGNIIIYDRYYFDFINDARRTNIQLNENFIKFFYRFIFKPDINIFLYALPEVILSRKQEMDKESIVELTNKYKNLFYSFSNKEKGKYICIENIDKEKTLKKIEKLYIEVI